jgi:ring-1,2-phenylacetyl-CoA epoxidase subunit PaaD
VRPAANVIDEETVRAAVGAVPDPELPMVTIEDLGILRAVELRPDGRVMVTITPTYSGCPAMETIATDIRTAVKACVAADVEVETVLAPPWTSDWITAEGRRKLAEAGIAPPGPVHDLARASGHADLEQSTARSRRVFVTISPCCPRCGSSQTRLVSRFGSTACKAIYSCSACKEPFDHFKAI